MLRFRYFGFIAAATALLISATPPPVVRAADLPILRVAKSSAVGIGFLPIEIGDAAGIWQKVGIKLDVSALRGDGQVQQALTAGDIDIGLGSGPGLGFVAKGVPAVAVGALSGAPASMGLVMGPKSTVKTVADLKGKRIGITTAGSLTDWLVRQIAVKQGWDISAITTVALGDTKGQAAALATGEIDGVCSASEFGYDLQDHNQGHMLMTFGSIVPDFLTQVIYARNDLVSQHPELVQKFLLGWYRSVIWMKSHRTEAIAIAVKAFGTDPHAVAETFDATMPSLSTDGHFNQQAVERLGKSFVELGILQSVPDMNTLITRKFVPVKT
jgi:NitT/TauT family transport system substrate-binding protein